MAISLRAAASLTVASGAFWPGCPASAALESLDRRNAEDRVGVGGITACDAFASFEAEGLLTRDEDHPAFALLHPGALAALTALAFGFGLTRVSAQVRMKKTPSQKEFTAATVKKN